MSLVNKNKLTFIKTKKEHKIRKDKTCIINEEPKYTDKNLINKLIWQ